MRLSFNTVKLLSIECRVLRDGKSMAYKGFEYRVYVRVKIRGSEMYYEWIVTGDPNHEEKKGLTLAYTSNIHKDDVYRIEH